MAMGHKTTNLALLNHYNQPLPLYSKSKNECLLEVKIAYLFPEMVVASLWKKGVIWW